MNRVPMLMPSAPSARAATRPRPSPKPPEAISGIFTLSAATGIRIRPGVSSSPGCPAHSKPSIEIASTPMRSADSAWRTLVHLCTTTMPCFLNSLTCSCGLFPAVSTILMPLSMMAIFRVGRRLDRGKDGEIDAERLVGEAAAARDLFCQILGRRLRQRGDEAERAGVGNGRDQFRASHPLHPALHKRGCAPDGPGKSR